MSTCRTPYTGTRKRTRNWRNTDHPESAIRLLGYLNLLWRSNATGTRWVRFSLSHFSEVSGLSTRQIQRAKNHLQTTGRVTFQTISNGVGRGHKVYAADPWDLTGTSGNLMAWTRAGRVRNRWTKIRGVRIGLPTSGGRRPTDIPIIGQSFQHSCSESPSRKLEKKVPPDADGGAPPRRPPPLVWNPLKKPTVQQRNLAWVTTRRIVKTAWWDNCKVDHPDRNLGGIYNLVLRWICRGVYTETIVKEFKDSLEKMHGLCVDFQLLKDAPNLRFHCGSTITRTDRSLCLLWGTNQLQHWSKFVVTTE